MLRKDLPIRNDLMDGATVIQQNNVASAQTFLSPIRSGLSSELTVTVPPPVENSLWTPSYIDTNVWLDASVADSVILSGGLVSQWLDLSGNNYHAIQTDSSARPSYVSSAITFNGSSQFLSLSTAAQLGNACSVFAVFESGNTSTQGLIYGEIGTVLGSNVKNYLAYLQSLGVFIDNFPPSGGFVGTGASTFFNTSVIGGFVQSAANARSLYVNGSFYDSSTETYSGGGITEILIGKRNQPSPDFLLGKIREIVAIKEPVLSDTQEKIEGYFAHKWLLTSSLPLAHPYKTTPPYIF